MPNQVQKAVNNERLIAPEVVAGHPLSPVHARLGVLLNADIRFDRAAHVVDPHLASAATGAQVQMSPEVKRHADEMIFAEQIRELEPDYQASDAAPQDAPQPPQVEEPRV